MTIIGGILGWLLRLERKHSTYLTRAEHEKICEDRNDRADKHLDNLRDDMEKRHEENSGRLERIEVEVRTGITGTHKRLDDLYRDLMARQRRGVT